MADDELVLDVTRGMPYARRFRVTGGRNIWPTVDEFEVRSHLRAGKTDTSALLLILTDYLTKSIEVDDILIDLTMTGEKTRLLQKGYFDIVLSDPGDVDVRGIRIGPGKVSVDGLITAVSDV